MWEMVNKDRDSKVCILFMQGTQGLPFGWIVGSRAGMLAIRVDRVWNHHLCFWGTHKHGFVCMGWGQQVLGWLYQEALEREETKGRGCSSGVGSKICNQ